MPKKSTKRSNTNSQNADSSEFMQKLQGWKAFEEFVSTLYENDDEAIIERNKIDIDKTGARRETDVKITHHKALHSYVTLVECKRWKYKVTRNRVDVLAASMEALNAQKGAIFTTKGYEAGAKAYAAGKGIDIFLVRDLTDEEWGLPGRNIHFYQRYWNGSYVQQGLNGEVKRSNPEEQSPICFSMPITPESLTDSRFDLYSLDGERGPNLVSIMKKGHLQILRHLTSRFGLQNDGKDMVVFITMVGKFDFQNAKHRQLRLSEGSIEISDLPFAFNARMSQKELKVDRGASVDMAVALENYLTLTKHSVVKRKEEEKSSLKKMANRSPEPEEAVLENGSVLDIFLSIHVPVDANYINAIVSSVAEVQLKLTTNQQQVNFEIEVKRPSIAILRG